MKIYISIVILTLFIRAGFAQEDTTAITIKDTILVIDKHDQQYKFFVENREPVTKHLWKINLVDLALFMPNFGYEQRLSKYWTVEGYFRYGNKTFLTLIPYDKHTVPSEEHTSSNIFELEQQFKYYFNIKHREKLGKKTNGFSGDYISSSLWYKTFGDSEVKNDSSSASQIKHFNIGIKYGLQRRLGKLGYFEFGLGLYYRFETIEWSRTNPPFSTPKTWNEHNNYFFPVLNFKVGFAIDSFDNLRRMIKD